MDAAWTPLLYLVDRWPGAAAVLDADLSVRHANPGFMKLVARPGMPAVPGAPLADLWPALTELRDETGFPGDGFIATAELAPPSDPGSRMTLRVRVAVPPLMTPPRRVLFLETREPADAALDLVADQRDRLLGTLATGVAHDLINPLSGIHQAMQLFDVDFRPDHPLHRERLVGAGFSADEIALIDGLIERRSWSRLLDVVIDSSRKASNRILQLMQLTGRRDPAEAELDLAEVMEEVYSFAHRDYTLKKQADFTLYELGRPPSGLHKVSGRHYQLAQALFMLLRQGMLRQVHRPFDPGAAAGGPLLWCRVTDAPGAPASVLIEIRWRVGETIQTVSSADMTPADVLAVRLVIERFHRGSVGWLVEGGQPAGFAVTLPRFVPAVLPV